MVEIVERDRCLGQAVPMLNITRRRVLAALTATLTGLGIRRAAALPVPVPVAIEPIPEPSIVCTEGWWVEPGGTMAYHHKIGWMHSFMPMRNLKKAQWYGPPPPLVPGSRMQGRKVSAKEAAGVLVGLDIPAAVRWKS